AVAAAATALAAWAAPDASRFYWTQALWDTGRVGRLDYVSNQSLQGVLARLTAPSEPSRAAWEAAVALVLAVWLWRTHRALRGGDLRAAFALTGLAACLVSPITWVHHLVWLLPSFAVLVHARRLRIAGALYAVLCSSVVWLWFDDPSGIDGFLGGNTYVWITLGLLLGLPVGHPRVGPPSLRRLVNATAPAPTAAATASVPVVSGQPGPSSRAAALTAGAVRAEDRSGGSEPTGLTRPAAANPQSSSERASS
ncbi:glycosyltransferase 87 family protein, partial [Streptomyces caeni]